MDAARLRLAVIMWNPDGASSSYIFKALFIIFQAQINLFLLEFIHR